MATPRSTGLQEALCCSPIASPRFSSDDAEELASLLKALADPIRLQIMAIVLEQGSACSCDLEGPLGRSQPTISHHTSILAEAGLLLGERRGRWTWWSVREERMEALRKAIGA